VTAAATAAAAHVATAGALLVQPLLLGPGAAAWQAGRQAGWLLLPASGCVGRLQEALPRLR
jgi:ABC-type Mn2+/Zn2+ transport system permease subunit